jgi:hypothetical protein
VYYSTLIFFIGAEITKVWWTPAALRRKEGDPVVPVGSVAPT